MARTIAFQCSACAAEAPKWLGRCPECGEWDGLREVAGPRGRGSATPPTPRCLVPDVGPSDSTPGVTPTGVAEVDRVLSGGLAMGSVTLLGGEPGIGKSTLVLQMLAGLAEPQRRCLLVTAEESEAQVGARARRVGATGPDFEVVASASVPEILAAVDAGAPAVIALDSVHTVSHPAVPGAPGSVSQVQACAVELAALARARDVAVVLVGHVTKDGSLAGPRALEHLVDTVLSFEGDRHDELRTLRALKHRFGRTGEVGVLEMTGVGLASVPDPSAALLGDRPAGASGSVVCAALDGRRPVLVEVQALVAPAAGPPRRSVRGVEPSRVAMLVAVVDRSLGETTARGDVYANVAGGLRVREPGVDLGLALALASAAQGRPVADDTVVMGEVGLAGEVRRVGQAEHRLAEAARMGFRRALVPPGSPSVPGISVIPVETVSSAVAAAGLS